MSSDEISESRRKWMQGTTAGLVAGVAMPAVAQTGA
ncbi:NAD(P)-dependent oxidoreductase, partial [Burkholderia multivorans]